MFSGKVNIDPEKLRGAKILKRFVAQHRGRWSYDDFLKLKETLVKAGNDIPTEAISHLLEDERLMYIKALVGEEAPAPVKGEAVTISLFKKPDEKLIAGLSLYKQEIEHLRQALGELAKQRDQLNKEINDAKKKKDELDDSIEKKTSELIGDRKRVEDETLRQKKVAAELDYMKKRLESKEKIYENLLHKIKIKEKHLDTVERNLILRENELQLRQKKQLIDQERLERLDHGFRKEKQELLQEVFNIEKKKNSLYTEIKELENLRERIEEEINRKREELVSRFRTNIETQKDLEVRKMEIETKETEQKMKDNLLARRAKEMEYQARILEMQKREFAKLVEAPERYKDEDIKMVVKELELREEELMDKERMLVEKERLILDKVRDLNKKAVEMYTKDLLKQGVEKEHIKAKLIDAGWDMQHINEHMSK